MWMESAGDIISSGHGPAVISQEWQLRIRKGMQEDHDQDFTDQGFFG